jgi:methionyl-tRNA synthetase
MGTFFLTTAIDYANAGPHLGHAYEKVLADVIARHRRSVGDDVFFLTGTDEHGQKIQQSAERAGRSPREFVNENSALFQDLCRRLEISHNRFVRTTDPGHVAKVQGWLQQLFDAGLIYKAEYEGFYSVRQEQFVTEKEMVDGVWPEIYGEVVRLSEANYYFKLSEFAGKLKAHVEKHPDWILPRFRRDDVLRFLDRPLGDLCISRPVARLSWGIPLPFDAGYVTYVWFDALANYATFATDEQGMDRWPADLHVIGKDILIPAHAIYWPCMLLGLGLPLPRQLLVHGWWQSEGAKMSKSTGNVVDPLSLIDRYGADAFRYFVMREMHVGYDADFTVAQFHARYQADLGNTLGNLVNRTISMINRYREAVIPEAQLDGAMLQARQEAFLEYESRMGSFEVSFALEALWKFAYRANQYVDQTAPWKLAKDPANADALNAVLGTLAVAVRFLMDAIAPVMPSTAGRIALQLGVPARTGSFVLVGLETEGSLAGTKVGAAEPLFPRIELADPS